MIAPARPERKRELRAAILSASLVMFGLLGVASSVVLWDTQGFRKKVESFFQIDLDAPRLAPSAAHYAQAAANTLSENLVRESENGLFRGLPGHPQESPSAEQLAAATLQTDPLPNPVREAAQEPAGPRSHPAIEREDRRQATLSALPVLGLHQVGSLPRRSDPDLAAHYRTGPGGRAALGTPGETLTLPERPLLEEQPQALSLLPAPAIPTRFAREERARAMTERLVSQRPERGYPSLDKDIEAIFTVYREPEETKATFRLELRLRPESTVPAIAKDLLILVDISQSVSLPELDEVRQGVLAILDSLRPADRWNVVLFSEQAHYYSEKPFFLPAAAFNREALARFISRQPDERRTNVYLAAQVILAKIPEGNRPSNVLLLSDGEATAGTADVRRIVHDFQRLNRDNFAIHPFNAGPKGNLYLLSLVAYRSRGFALNCPELTEVATALPAFARRVSEPVLTNVVASTTNIQAEEVYPVVLPNLYRETPILVWGRAAPGEKVALRVAGLAQDGPREFFFETRMPAGDTHAPDVVREWARGKAHALMAELADNEKNVELRAEIDALATRYTLDDILRLPGFGPRRSLLPWRND